MVTRDSAAAFSRGFRVIDNRPTQTGVIRHANVRWTSEAAKRLEFKGADVCAVAGRSIGDARVVVRARTTTLIKCSASRYSCVDGGAAGRKRHRLGWAAIVRQRRQHRVGAGLVTGPGEARCFSGNTEEVVTVAGDGAVHIGSGSWGTGGVAGTIGGSIARNNCVLQSHTAGAYANAAASTFGHKARWEVSSALVDAAVARLSIV